jgi:hypothetical protein
VVVAALAAVTAMTVARSGSRPVLRALLWGVCALSVVCAFGLLMNMITLIVSQEVDSRVATLNQALAAIGAVLLAATARSHRAAACTRCGGLHDSAVRPEPSRAPRPVRLAAYAGTVAFLPYATMKVTWALGGTFAGMSGAAMLAIAKRNGASGLWLTLESWGLDATALLAGLGVFLIFGLIRPWGQVFPRWTLFLRGRGGISHWRRNDRDRGSHPPSSRRRRSRPLGPGMRMREQRATTRERYEAPRLQLPSGHQSGTGEDRVTTASWAREVMPSLGNAL